MDSKKKSYAINALRRASYRWPARGQVDKKQRVERGKYYCNICKAVFRKKDTQMDHVSSVIPVTGWDSFDGYIDRMFCDVAGFQRICKPCHLNKSQGENSTRKIFRDIKKENNKKVK